MNDFTAIRFLLRRNFSSSFLLHCLQNIPPLCNPVSALFLSRWHINNDYFITVKIKDWGQNEFDRSIL